MYKNTLFCKNTPKKLIFLPKSFILLKSPINWLFNHPLDFVTTPFKPIKILFLGGPLEVLGKKCPPCHTKEKTKKHKKDMFSLLKFQKQGHFWNPLVKTHLIHVSVFSKGLHLDLLFFNIP